MSENSPSTKFISEKLKSIKLLVFDWDGVFNDGFKTDEKGSGFSEIDAMGTNLLRFSQYLRTNGLPKSIILTGLNNHLARQFAQRESFDAIYFGFKDKTVALEHIKLTYDVKEEEVAFFYDDVLDLSVSSQVGLRMYIDHPSKARLTEYLKENRLFDYRTTNSGGSGGLREACDFLIDCNHNFSEVIKHRVKFDDNYKEYLVLRAANSTNQYSVSEGKIISI